LKKFVFCILIIFLMGVFASTAMAEEPLPYVEPANCPIDVPPDRNIECGVLVAPENYAEPDGSVVRLPYIYIHSISPRKEPTPLLFTEGGPGYSSLSQVWGYAYSVLVENRDMIIFEQRGNRYAEPSLRCEYDEIASPDNQTSPCLDRILALGIDITQYTTAVIAEDIESLRIALGFEQWDLFGTSYSTRPIQLLMERHPEGIRSVILHATNILYETRFEYDPKNSMRSLRLMFDDCAADAACADAFPNLEKQFYQAVADLNERPVKMEFTAPQDGSTFEYVVDGNRLIEWMVGSAFYGPTFPHYDSAYLPLLIRFASQRNTSVLRHWAERSLMNDVFLGDDFVIGLYFAVNCQDDTTTVTEEQLQAQRDAYPELGGYLRHGVEYEVCKLWGLPHAPPLAEGPPTSDIPTLVLVGSYDPITPPEWSREVADSLSHSYYVEFRSKGHNVDAVTACPQVIKNNFLLDPWTEPDTSCLADEPPVGYVLPGDLFLMPGFEQSLADINYGVPDQGIPALEAFSGAATIIFLLSVVLALVLGLVVLFSRKNRQQKREQFNLYGLLLAALVGVLSVGVVVLMSMVNQVDIPFQRVTQIFGLPADYPYVRPMGIVVYLQIIFTVVLAAVTARSWVKQRGAFFSRVALTLVTLAALSFWYFFLRWDLTDILIQMLVS